MTAGMFGTFASPVASPASSGEQFGSLGLAWRNLEIMSPEEISKKTKR